MLVTFSSIFVADTIIIIFYNFVALLTLGKMQRTFPLYLLLLFSYDLIDRQLLFDLFLAKENFLLFQDITTLVLSRPN